MNSYRLLADSYKGLLLHDDNIDKDDIQRKIDALEHIADANDKQIYALFDTSAFNCIVKGYVKKACDNMGNGSEERQKMLNEISLLFDEIDAEQAENYYYTN